MRAHEFLTDDRESLITYLVLFGFNLPDLKQQSIQAIKQYTDGSITWDELDNILYLVNKEISAIMIDNVWDRFSDDPDRVTLYADVSALYRKNQNFLDSTHPLAR